MAGDSREQPGLLPPRIEDYVGPQNPVRAIESFVCALDLAKLGFRHADRTADEVGQPPYDPADLLKLYLYGDINQIRSSRRLEREACRNLELIWLLKNLKPGYRTIANFRKENWAALKGREPQFRAATSRTRPDRRERCCGRRRLVPRQCQQGEHLHAREADQTDRRAGQGDRGLWQGSRSHGIKAYVPGREGNGKLEKEGRFSRKDFSYDASAAARPANCYVRRTGVGRMRAAASRSATWRARRPAQHVP
jgi:hypothetical protein